MRHRQFSLPDFCNHFTEERIRTLLLRPEMKREYFGHGESLLIESINRMSFFETGNYLLWEKATFFKSSGKVVIENKNDDPLENHSATAYQNWVIETFLSDSVGDIRVEKKNLEGKLVRSFILIFYSFLIRRNGSLGQTISAILFLAEEKPSFFQIMFLGKILFIAFIHFLPLFFATVYWQIFT